MLVGVLPCRSAQATRKKSHLPTNPCVPAPRHLRRSGVGFAVPPRSPDGLLRAWRHAPMSEQGDEREQSHKRRCSTPDRHIRPLPLRLESKVPAHLMKGHLKLPAHNKPAEDLLGIGLEVGTKEGLGFELSFRITYQHPAQEGYGEQARGVPNGRLSSTLAIWLHSKPHQPTDAGMP